MFNEQQQYRIDEIRTRLDVFAEHEKLSPADVVSLKLRPVQLRPAAGAEPQFESQDYTTELIYPDLRAEYHIVPVPRELATRLRRDGKAYWLDLDGRQGACPLALRLCHGTLLAAKTVVAARAGRQA